MRRATLAVAVVALLAGCGSGAQTRLAIGVSGRGLGSEWSHFSLSCHPAGGDMPHRDELCRLIDAHPNAMLHPAETSGTCMGGFAMPEVDVTGTRDGRPVSLGGYAACGPGTLGLAAYWAAARRPGLLAEVAARLG